MRNWRWLVSIVLGLSVMIGVSSAIAADAQPRVRLKTTEGEIVIQLDAEKAPGTVENFLGYVQSGYYAGTIFHRVIPGFMIQGGGLDAELKEKSEGQRPAIKNESDNGLKNETGTVAMARTSVPDSATSQFFINVKDNAFLDRAQAQDGVGYAVFGRVVEGMDAVKKIEGRKVGVRGVHRDVPVEPVTIIEASIVDGDAAPAGAPSSGEEKDRK